MRVVLVLAALLGLSVAPAEAGEPRQRPNILWITCEDISPNLGCYGDGYAVTPHLDRLASQSVRYTQAFAPIGVCAPSRSCLITGMYPPSIGTHPMRCSGTLPEHIKCFTEHLRQAGYYCSNNVKTDYNFQHAPSAWDESSNRAHWRKRGQGQPFFSVVNFITTHESQIRLPEAEYAKRTADFTSREQHDPDRVSLPPYHPDAPEVRRDWARYADMITVMDKQVAAVLKQLEEDGLTDDTIVFFFSDHGAGMPRSKRWLYDSSLRVPLLIRFPKTWERFAPGLPGTATDRLVSFVDFAPSVLSLTGVSIPAHLQGQAFLGDKAAPPRQYVFGFRDRMDERTDMLRAVRDRRYKYVRNYLPHLPYFHHQYVSYMYQMPTMQAWQRLADAGKLTGPAAIFMAAVKPMDELYDTETDPHEVRNLADAAEHRTVLERMRTAHLRWMEEIIDLGLLPEGDLRSRFAGEPEYAAVRRHPNAYPLRRIAEAADLAGRRDAVALPKLIELLPDADAAVRYWAAVGIGALGAKAGPAAEPLRKALADPAPTVRVVAADALCHCGRPGEALPVLTQMMQDDNEWVRLQAINVLDRLDEQARPAQAVLEKARLDKNQYVVRVATHALQDLAGPLRKKRANGKP